MDQKGPARKLRNKHFITIKVYQVTQELLQDSIDKLESERQVFLKSEIRRSSLMKCAVHS